LSEDINPALKGQIIEDQIRQIDIMPTILDMVGLADKIPLYLDGRIITPLLEGKEMPEMPAFIETCQTPSQPSDLYGVRSKGWKYATHISDPSVADELYDLTSDPRETQNLAETRPDIIREMRALLDDHLQTEQRKSVSLADDLSGDELNELAKHLEKLGYIE
jgi:arylsulfatase A-like enzyme